MNSNLNGSSRLEGLMPYAAKIRRSGRWRMRRQFRGHHWPEVIGLSQCFAALPFGWRKHERNVKRLQTEGIPQGMDTWTTFSIPARSSWFVLHLSWHTFSINIIVAWDSERGCRHFSAAICTHLLSSSFLLTAFFCASSVFPFLSF